MRQGIRGLAALGARRPNVSSYGDIIEFQITAKMVRDVKDMGIVVSRRS